MKLIQIFGRVIAGIVFLFSGFVKAVDPLGTAYKFTDYFIAFNIEWLRTIALPLAILMIAGELFIGFSMFTSIRLKLGSWLLLIYMIIFTPVTLYIAIKNPVSDCGCFGDALVITNWETFWKNIVLLAIAIYLFRDRNCIKPNYEAFVEWLFAVSFVITAFLFISHNLRHLPILDFRPYKIGANIRIDSNIPDDAEPDVYETTLIYEKKGERKSFHQDSIPWQDTSWKYVDSESVLVKKGYKPPIHDFSLTSMDGYAITGEFLNDPAVSFLLVSYNLKKTNKEAFIEANKLAEYAKNNGIKFYCATASLVEDIEQYKMISPDIEFVTADETALKTVIRSNPGLLLVQDATILGKWHFNDFPDVDKLKKSTPAPFAISEMRHEKDKLVIYLCMAVFLFALLFVKSRLT